jgi:hypothetical protein
MTILAKDMRPGAIYRRTVEPGGFWYTRPAAGTARRLARRLAPRTLRLSMCDLTALIAAREDLAGRAVLVLRHQRGIDPMTRERFELQDYVGVTLNYRFREVKRKPGFEERD